jgi:hypothetical protein
MFGNRRRKQDGQVVIMRREDNGDRIESEAEGKRREREDARSEKAAVDGVEPGGLQ